MANTTDSANVIIRLPIAWAVSVLAGLALNRLTPLPFVPAVAPAGWLGAMVFALALALFAWAIATITRAGSNVPSSLPTTTIVDTGPYRFTRNPISSESSVRSIVATSPAFAVGCNGQAPSQAAQFRQSRGDRQNDWRTS